MSNSLLLEFIQMTELTVQSNFYKMTCMTLECCAAVIK